MIETIKKLPKSLLVALCIMLTGLILRLYGIWDNQFLFYDEGMYLGQNRGFLDLVAANPPHSMGEFFVILGLMFKMALSTAKALWFFLLNLRVFILGPEAWYFARLVSAVSGIATIVLVFFWVKRYLHSERIALLSAVLLSVLPSHVFYSRLGMQESFSTFLFLSAIYLYMANRRIHWQFFVSAIVLSCVYFTNYRMIIAPVFIGLIEIFLCWQAKEKINWLKLFWFGLVFYGIVFFFGNLYGGINREVTFGWMTHQAQDASGKFDPINFLSYPYYVFALEGIFFGLLFWANLGFVIQKLWERLLPFGIVVVQMALFSFAAEKGARYICVVLPFMAVAAAVVADDWLSQTGKMRSIGRSILGLALIGMIVLSGLLASSKTDYAQAVHFILDHDPQAVMVTTQPLVEALYVQKEGQIIPCPKDLGSLVEAYKQGARYLILDPQAYISWTADTKRFSPPLIDFMEFTRDNVQPLQSFDHLNNIYLNRFVLDHNENLIDSLRFLSDPHDYGKIKIYDLGVVLSTLHGRN